MTPVSKNCEYQTRAGLCRGLVMALVLLHLPPALGQTRPGLALTISTNDTGTGGAVDGLTSPNARLFVPAGKPVTPFVAPGKFQAVWSGFVVMDLRSEYAFQAELNGHARVEINGQTVLEGAGDGAVTVSSKGVRLRKGANPVKITFTSPSQGDAFMRLLWSDKPGKPGPFEPVPDAVWERGPDSADVKAGLQLRLGRELVIERRCLKCHDAGLGAKAIPELGMDAPSFEGIGSRRRAEWIAEWVRDPHGARPLARMPQVLHGAKTAEEAGAIALYLASLKAADEPGAGSGKASGLGSEDVEAGEKLFTTLNCAGCHLAPESTEDDPAKIPLKRVGRKFVQGQLAAFLLKPEAHYSWIRMPNFKFSDGEASNLAAWLLSTAEKAKDEGGSSPAEGVAAGRQLVQNSGCLNCHAGGGENLFSTKKLANLSHRDQGCLAAAPSEGSTAPRFEFSEEDRAAIGAFLRSPLALSSLQTDVPTEFAERQTRLLNCRACHGQMEGFPPLDLLGGKLRPEWMAKFIGGEVTYKPRHWLPARMPAFKTRASEIAAGLVMQQGIPPASPVEPPVNTELAEVGRKLVSVNGGFSCVLCHGINKTLAMQVFESEGVNFGRSAERLQPAYFYRWVRNPQGIDPQTKMPRFFAEGDKSPLGDVLNGDIQKQLDAFWSYIRLGEKMQPPAGPSGH